MTEFDVKWETTADADDARDAASRAVDLMYNQLRSLDYFSPILDVTNKETGELTRFDMETGETIPTGKGPINDKDHNVIGR